MPYRLTGILEVAIATDDAIQIVVITLHYITLTGGHPGQIDEYISIAASDDCFRLFL